MNLLVKTSQRIKFLNKYIEGLKGEIEETTEKYDKMAIKYRDLMKSSGNISVSLDDIMREKENVEFKNHELQSYV